MPDDDPEFFGRDAHVAMQSTVLWMGPLLRGSAGFCAVGRLTVISLLALSASAQAVDDVDLKHLKATNSCFGCDLGEAELREANLSGADLHEANLFGANLFGAELFAADLSGADLRGANLARTRLRGVNLTGADLRGADLRVADMSMAELNEPKRREMYVEMQLIVRDEGGVVIPIFNNYLFAMSTKVQHDEVMGGDGDLDGTKALERWWFA